MSNLEEYYASLDKEELGLHLDIIEDEAKEIQEERDELDKKEQVLQDHRNIVLRLLGIVVLGDYQDEN